MATTILTPGFAGALLASLIVSIDAVALSISIPTIAEELNATSSEAYWSATSFVIASLAAQPLFPGLATYGHKYALLLALVVFAVGTIICGVSLSIQALIAGRAVQGVGGGGILAMLYIVMAELDLVQRSKAQALNGLIWMLGLSVGPIMSGGFITVTWRWIFWITLPIAGIAGCLSVFLNGPAHRHTRKVDWLGVGLLVSSLVAVLIPITWGGVQYNWSSWHVVAPLVIGIAGLGAWLLYESRISDPILPLKILVDKSTAVSLVGTFIIGICQYGLIFYLPLYYQVVKGYSPLLAGVALLPETALAGPSTFIAGMVVAKRRRYLLVIWTGWTLAALGCGLLILLDAETSPAQWFWITAISGIGLGMVTPAVAIASQANVAQEHLAVVSMLTPFIRALGQAVGIVVGNAIVQNVMRQALGGIADADEVVRGFASPEVVRRLGQDVLPAYVLGLRAFWWFLFGACCLAGLLSLATREMPSAACATEKSKSSSVGKAGTQHIAEAEVHGTGA